MCLFCVYPKCSDCMAVSSVNAMGALTKRGFFFERYDR